MASGDLIFNLTSFGTSPPATLYASRGEIADTSTPAIVFQTINFASAADLHMDWIRTLPTWYASTTGLTFCYKYATDGSDTTGVELEFRVLPLADLDILTGDLGIDTQTAVTITDTPPATPTDKLSKSTTGALAKASFGSAVGGTDVVIRCTRDVSFSANSDILQLLNVYVTET